MLEWWEDQKKAELTMITVAKSNFKYSYHKEINIWKEEWDNYYDLIILVYKKLLKTTKSV